jgi:predicted TIM-barrel fold metal-dependent hydrolase
MALLNAAPAVGSDAVEVPRVDHHLHMFSPATSQALKAICTAKGPDACPAEVSREASTADDVIRALDAAGVQQGVLLSNAYMFGSPVIADQQLDIAAAMRTENSFIVAQAQAHCGRLIPFISVNPLLPNAIAEIDYWGKTGGAAGLKLHLGNSGFDFRDSQQVAGLVAVFSAANRNGLAIAVHLQTQPSRYGAEDARIFLQQVLPVATTVPIQIAHIGSGGGLDGSVLSVLDVFAEEIRSRPKQTRHLYFDLAMVPDLFSNTRKLSAKADDVAALDTTMRRIGLGRFLPASDWTLGLDLKAYYANQKASLQLTDREWRKLVTNAAPYVKKSLATRRSACSR